MLTGFYWIISRWLDYDFVVSMIIFRAHMYIHTYYARAYTLSISKIFQYCHQSHTHMSHYDTISNALCIIQRSFVKLRALDRPSYLIHPTVSYSQNVKTYVLVSTGLLSWIIDWIITRLLLNSIIQDFYWILIIIHWI